MVDGTKGIDHSKALEQGKEIIEGSEANLDGLEAAKPVSELGPREIETRFGVVKLPPLPEKTAVPEANESVNEPNYDPRNDPETVEYADYHSEKSFQEFEEAGGTGEFKAHYTGPAVNDEPAAEGPAQGQDPVVVVEKTAQETLASNRAWLETGEGRIAEAKGQDEVEPVIEADKTTEKTDQAAPTAKPTQDKAEPEPWYTQAAGRDIEGPAEAAEELKRLDERGITEATLVRGNGETVVVDVKAELAKEELKAYQQAERVEVVNERAAEPERSTGWTAQHMIDKTADELKAFEKNLQKGAYEPVKPDLTPKGVHGAQEQLGTYPEGLPAKKDLGGHLHFNALESVYNVVGTAAGNVKDAAKDGYGIIADAAKDGVKKVGEKMDEAKDWARNSDAVANIGEKVASTFESVIGKIAELKSGIEEKLGLNTESATEKPGAIQEQAAPEAAPEKQAPALTPEAETAPTTDQAKAPDQGHDKAGSIEYDPRTEKFTEGDKGQDQGHTMHIEGLDRWPMPQRDQYEQLHAGGYTKLEIETGNGKITEVDIQKEIAEREAFETFGRSKEHAADRAEMEACRYDELKFEAAKIVEEKGAPENHAEAAREAFGADLNDHERENMQANGEPVFPAQEKENEADLTPDRGEAVTVHHHEETAPGDSQAIATNELEAYQVAEGYEPHDNSSIDSSHSPAADNRSIDEGPDHDR